MNAVEITHETTMGSTRFNDSDDEPGGTNCFGVRSDEGRFYRIVNFKVEDLEKLQKKGLTWPLACEVLREPKEEKGEGIAAVHDHRIGERWYQPRWCEVCCPNDLLPLPQRMIHEREIKRGRRKESKRSGYTMVMVGGTGGAEFE